MKTSLQSILRTMVAACVAIALDTASTSANTTSANDLVTTAALLDDTTHNAVTATMLASKAASGKLFVTDY